jgi:hypothetical protein
MDHLKIDPKIKLKNCGRKGIKGETTMKTKDGDTVKSLLNDRYYKVKRIVNSMVILQSEDGQSQILTEVGNLNLFYKKKESIKV